MTISYLKNEKLFFISYCAFLVVIILIVSIFFMNYVIFEGPVQSQRSLLVAVVISALFLPFYLLNDKVFFTYVVAAPLLQRTYQVLVYDDFAVGDSFLRMLVMIHLSICITIWLKFKKIQISYLELLLVLTWIIINILPVIYADYSKGGWLPFLSVYLPILLYFFFRTYLDKYSIGKSFEDVYSVVTKVFLFFLIVSISMFFVELKLRGSSSLMGVQFVDTYSTIALILLLWPIFISSLSSSSYSFNVFFYSGVILFLCLSFSRGAIATLGVVILISLIISTGIKRFLFYFFISFLVFLLLYPFLPDFIKDIFWTWGLRLNVVSNFGNGEVLFDVNAFLNNSRQAIRDYAWLAIYDTEFLGIGINNTPHVFKNLSNGNMSFGSVHNFSLTVLLERGIAFLIAMLVIFSFLFFSFLTNRGGDSLYSKAGFIGFTGFLLFSHTTGAEYILNSRYLVNLDVAFFVTLIFCLSIHKFKHGKCS